MTGDATAGIASPGHIRSIPKVELHVHVEGAATPSTLASLAKKNTIELPVHDPADLYSYEGFVAQLLELRANMGEPGRVFRP